MGSCCEVAVDLLRFAYKAVVTASSASAASARCFCAVSKKVVGEWWLALKASGRARSSGVACGTWLNFVPLIGVKGSRGW